ncbi:MAG: NTP transferase domain-containing protein [Candidatus Aminicenantales bacterium]
MICAIVLAAGESRRMGTPKLLLPFGEKTIMETVLESILQSRVEGVFVILGAGGKKIEKKIAHLPVSLVFNRRYREGMLSSIQAGFRALPAETKAAVVCLGDQPLVAPAVIDELIEAYERSRKRIVSPTYRGKRGHPILIDCGYREDIQRLDPRIGLRKLLHDHPEDVQDVEVASPHILEDIDIPADYSRAKKTGDTR